MEAGFTEMCHGATPNMIAERTQILPTLETRLTLEATSDSTLGRRMASSRASSFLSSYANASKNIGWPSTSPPSLRQFPPTHYPLEIAIQSGTRVHALGDLPSGAGGRTWKGSVAVQVSGRPSAHERRRPSGTVRFCQRFLILFGTFVAPMRLRRG